MDHLIEDRNERILQYLKTEGKDRRVIFAFSNPLKRYWDRGTFDEKGFRKVSSLLWPGLKGFQSFIGMYGVSKPLKDEAKKHKRSESGGWCDRIHLGKQPSAKINLSLTFTMPWETGVEYHSDCIIVKGQLRSGRSESLGCTAFELPIKTESREGEGRSSGKLSFYCILPDRNVNLKVSDLSVSHLINVVNEFSMEAGISQICLPNQKVCATHNFQNGVVKVKVLSKFKYIRPTTTRKSSSPFLSDPTECKASVDLLDRPFIFFMLYTPSPNSKSVIILAGWETPVEIAREPARSSRSPSLQPEIRKARAEHTPEETSVNRLIPSTSLSTSSTSRHSTLHNPSALCYSSTSFRDFFDQPCCLQSSAHSHIHPSLPRRTMDSPTISTHSSTLPHSTLPHWPSTLLVPESIDVSKVESCSQANNLESFCRASSHSARENIHLSPRTNIYPLLQFDTQSRLQPQTPIVTRTNNTSYTTFQPKLQTPSAQQSGQQDQGHENLSEFYYPIRLFKSKLWSRWIHSACHVICFLSLPFPFLDDLNPDWSDCWYCTFS